ncbi:MAG: hypothetical protein EZS28_045641, partial [Streblomastix strix]
MQPGGGVSKKTSVSKQKASLKAPTRPYTPRDDTRTLIKGSDYIRPESGRPPVITQLSARPPSQTAITPLPLPGTTGSKLGIAVPKTPPAGGRLPALPSTSPNDSQQQKRNKHAPVIQPHPGKPQPVLITGGEKQQISPPQQRSITQNQTQQLQQPQKPQQQINKQQQIKSHSHLNEGKEPEVDKKLGIPATQEGQVLFNELFSDTTVYNPLVNLKALTSDS